MPTSERGTFDDPGLLLDASWSGFDGPGPFVLPEVEMTIPIPSYAVTSLRVLLWADGVHPIQRWDGMAPAPSEAGLPAPSTAPTLTASGTGTLTGRYYAYLRFVDRAENYSDPSPISGVLDVTDIGSVQYAGVEAAPVGEPRIVRRQLLRNTAGQASVFYLDVDTTDLTSTTFTSTLDDETLGSQVAVPLFDSSNLPYMASHARPPDTKAVLCVHRDRLFLAGEFVYGEGCVRVTNGSTTVSGSGTRWPANFVGRQVWVDGAPEAYDVSAVDPVGQTLTLGVVYGGPSNPYARYAIRGAVGESKLIYFSGAGEEESVPAYNAISVPPDDDVITGLMPMGSWVYVLERGHIYRLTYKDGPAEDGGLFHCVDRGCVNPRCWVIVEGSAYLLDEAGIYQYDGGDGVQAVSDPIQDLWETGPTSPGDLRIQWAARNTFHANWYPAHGVIRWFVTLDGSPYPRHALGLDVRQKRLWVEEYSPQMASSCLGRLPSGPAVYLGSCGPVYALGASSLDGLTAGAVPPRSVVTVATTLTLSDTSAHFPATVVGQTVSISAGTGFGQTRLIVEATATQLVLDRPWSVLPRSDSVYQIAGVPYQFRSGWMRWMIDENLRPRRLEINFKPLLLPVTLTARLREDRSTLPDIFAAYYGQEWNRLSSSPGSPDLVADLTKPNGMVQRRLDASRDFYLDGKNRVAVELAGVAGAEPVVLLSLLVDGAVQ